MKCLKGSLLFLLFAHSAFGADWKLDNFDNFVSKPLDSQKVLPQASVDQNRLIKRKLVFLNRIDVKGSTIISPAQMKMVTSDYLARNVSMQELEILRQQIQQLYLDQGFSSTQVYLPDQDVADQQLDIHITEGSLLGMSLRGNENVKTAYIARRIRQAASVPLNLHTLELAVAELQRDPLIDEVQAYLSPVNEKGQSFLSLKIREAKPYHVKAGLSNHRSPSVGAERINLAGLHRNLFGWGDTLGMELGYTGSQLDLSSLYEVALNRYNTRFRAYNVESDAAIIEEPFESLNISSRSSVIGLGVSHPLVWQFNHQLNLSTALEARHNWTRLDGMALPLPGAEQGKSVTNSLLLGAQFGMQGKGQALSSYLRFRQGLDMVDSSINDEGPQGLYTSLQAGISYQYLLSRRWGGVQSDFRIQKAFDPLMNIEKSALGGHATVRGYRENTLLRDNTVNITAQWRLPILQNYRFWKQQSHGVVFLDWGRGWNEYFRYSNGFEINRDEQQLLSIGMAYELKLFKTFQAQASWGLPVLGRDQIRRGDIQDSGVQFSLEYQIL